MDAEWVRNLVDLIVNSGLRIIIALAIFVVGKWVATRIRGVVGKAMKKKEVEPTLINFVTNFVYIGLMVFVILAALGKLGVQTASFVAVIGAAGLAVGLALQGSLANFAAGVLLIIFRPIKVGDYVEVGGKSGSVEKIEIFTTNLTTPDNKAVIVPNAQVLGNPITNYSAKPTRRVDCVFGIGYDDDILKAKKILEEIIKSDDRILDDPAPTIAVLELGDSSVNFAVRPWVKTADYWGVFFDLQEKIKLRFDEEGITIPFPQRDVHMYHEDK
jgi:small conductance mechanosensitive channel